MRESGKAKAAPKAKRAAPKAAKAPRTAVAKKAAPKAGSKPEPKNGKVRLLSGGNPQIAKGDGDAPVQAYIAAMPGWKSDVGRRLDAIIMRALPNVQKAIKWNSPFYGAEGNGYFLGIHCFDKYVKVAFFHGTSLTPVPPGPSKDKNTRYLDIREGDEIDEKLIADWVRQSAVEPGFLAPKS
jgi:hypothetical protein